MVEIGGIVFGCCKGPCMEMRVGMVEEEEGEGEILMGMRRRLGSEEDDSPESALSYLDSKRSNRGSWTEECPALEYWWLCRSLQGPPQPK